MMKLKKRTALLMMCISVLLTGCGGSGKVNMAELTDKERETLILREWFNNDISDEEEFTDVNDYRYYARSAGLEKDALLSPAMWEIYYSENININKEIDGTAIYLIRLNPDKLLEVWAKNNETTEDEICRMMGTNRDDLYYNFGYTANSIGYTKNHKANNLSYPEIENKIFGADNGENRQVVFSTHFLKISGETVTYESTDDNLAIKQRDLLKSVTNPRTYDYSNYEVQELTPAFYINETGIRRLLVLAIPNGWANAEDTEVSVMFNMSPYSYGCTDDDLLKLFIAEDEAVSESGETTADESTENHTVSETAAVSDTAVTKGEE